MAKTASVVVGVLCLVACMLGILPLMFSAMLLDSPNADWTMYLGVDCILLWFPAWILAWLLSVIGAYRNSLRWLWGLILPTACIIGLIVSFSCGK